MNKPSSDRQKGVMLAKGPILEVYSPSMQMVYSVQLMPDSYADMEIVNEDNATTQLIDFFALHKIPPTEFILLIQNPLFKKEFTMAPSEQLESAIATYLDCVPFENVLSKRLRTEKGVYLIAANGDYFASLQKMFTKVGCTIESITPLDGLDSQINSLTALSTTSATYILSQYQSIRQEGFPLVAKRSESEFEIVETIQPQKEEKSQLPMLLAVFGILLAILALVYWRTYMVPAPVPTKTVPSVKPTVAQ